MVSQQFEIHEKIHNNLDEYLVDYHLLGKHANWGEPSRVRTNGKQWVVSSISRHPLHVYILLILMKKAYKYPVCYLKKKKGMEF